MDYSVGSLADLITGSTTPNKPRVTVKKQIALPLSETSITIPTKKHEQNNANLAVKTVKKRKLHSDEGAPEAKKSKNSENAKKRLVGYKNTFKKEEDEEIVSRTIFVGNLPITLNPKKLKKLFTKYGNIESTRLRGISVADPKVPKKIAMIKKEFHPDRNSFHGYVRFEKREDALKATEMNGFIYKDHHLRVGLCDAKDRPDESKAIFIGNLSFYAEEDDLWKLFEVCGPVESVRIIRDAKTGMGKGFGYVNFKNSDSVALALEMENVRFKDRELRISICNLKAAKKNRKNNEAKKITKPGKSFKGQKREKKVHEVQDQESQESGRLSMKKNKERQFEENVNGSKVRASQGFKNSSFQGVKFVHKKKKGKLNKGLLKKKKMVEKVAPK